MSSVRSIASVIWLGLFHDIGWTSPVVGMAMQTILPIASAITTSIIYWLGSTTGNTFDPTELAFVLVGSILYTHIAAYAYSPTSAIAEGKNLSVFSHIYITPRSSTIYLTGRTLASFVIAFVSSVIALIVDYFILGGILHTSIPLIINPLSVILFTIALVLNIPASLGLGLMLGAYSLFASKFEWALSSYIAGILMVFSGALFSPSILPWPLSAFGNALPYTQSISAARDALIYGHLSAYSVSLAYSFFVGCAVLALGFIVYSRSEKKARQDGVIDRRLA